MEEKENNEEKNGNGGGTFPGWKRPSQDERGLWCLGGFGMIIRAVEPGVSASNVLLGECNPRAGSSIAPPGGSVEPWLLCR